MIRVSRLADYAVVIIVKIATGETELTTGTSISRQTGLPEPTVAKVLKLLAKADILASVRGANGGYKINGKPEDIKISDVIMAVDGPIALTACVEGSTASCDYECSCPVKGRWDHVNDALRGALEDISMADMIKPNNDGFIKAHEGEVVHERI